MEWRVLVTDDEQSIAGAIAYALTREGMQVETAGDGEEALRKIDAFKPHLLVLDVMMPKMDGYEVCRRLLQREDAPGILLLTVKNDIIDKVLGLELGADDYMTKPFDLRELVARVKALGRRLAKNAAPTAVKSVELGPLEVRLQERMAQLSGREIELTPKEFDLLALLATHPNQVYTREDLLELVWGMDYAGGTRTVDIHIQRLRKKLEPVGPVLLQTVYGIGYKLIEVK
ncbi:response regulator transcription factor [Paenibacillus pinihumi]|uniref:response regulator transcription factor n=1 Tax=Paenibacillus pinihumi TaxID=669462 RepID=UPI0003F73ACE|nr:response regulator transcription factor [Paenibacillus pinihumi]